MPKPSGKPIKIVDGLEIYVSEKKSKTGRGKDRIWISVRQDNPIVDLGMPQGVILAKLTGQGFMT